MYNLNYLSMQQLNSLAFEDGLRFLENISFEISNTYCAGLQIQDCKFMTVILNVFQGFIF